MSRIPNFEDLEAQEIKELEHKFAQWDAQMEAEKERAKRCLSNFSLGFSNHNEENLTEAVQAINSNPDLFYRTNVQGCLSMIEELYGQLEEAISELEESLALEED